MKRVTHADALGVAVVVLSALAASAASWWGATRTSATFDEPVLVAAGVRGLRTGRWETVTDQPPLPMYLYGWAASGVVDDLPPEPPEGVPFEARWRYARALVFGSPVRPPAEPGGEGGALVPPLPESGGEETAPATPGRAEVGRERAADPHPALTRARRVAAALAGLTVLAAGGFAGWAGGPVAAAVAAVATAALPDVLAHGGVAYNDLPLALFFLLAVWAVDTALRRPRPMAGLVAGAALACALGVKLSALALGPVAVVLVALEAARRGRGVRAWLPELGVTVLVAMAAMYTVLVVLYRGDPTLTLFRFNFLRTVFHASAGHEAPAYLLGRTSPDGFWYFFPVAFLFKTPVAFHLLLSGALGLGAVTMRRWGKAPGSGTGGDVEANRAPGRSVWSALAGWRGRGALVGSVVFGVFLMRSSLNAGFRYALPVLPLLAVAAAVVWGRFRGAVAWVVAALLTLQVLSTAAAGPHFLAFTSLYAGGKDRGHEVLVDSSLDWGQGLLELRRFMQAEGVERVALSYFGSAPPEAYGIRYLALPSFFRLDGGEGVSGAADRPRFTVISATNLHGLYLQGRDPFAAYREREPYAVLGHTLFVFDDAG